MKISTQMFLATDDSAIDMQLRSQINRPEEGADMRALQWTTGLCGGNPPLATAPRGELTVANACRHFVKWAQRALPLTEQFLKILDAVENNLMNGRGRVLAGEASSTTVFRWPHFQGAWNSFATLVVKSPSFPDSCSRPRYSVRTLYRSDDDDYRTESP